MIRFEPIPAPPGASVDLQLHAANRQLEYHRWRESEQDRRITGLHAKIRKLTIALSIAVGAIAGLVCYSLLTWIKAQ